VHKSSTTLDPALIRELARKGAETVLRELQASITAIERGFPELASQTGSQSTKSSLKATGRRRRQMSAAARREVSVRMKKYWAERRKAKRKVA